MIGLIADMSTPLLKGSLKGDVTWWTIPLGLILGIAPVIAFVFWLDWMIRRYQSRR